MNCVDLFAGIGGNTEAAASLGWDVKWAANHSPLAVEYHAKNNPNTAHSCQDLQQADFSEVPKHDLLLASPCCQGHTNARGKDRGPHHHKSRSTAWAPLNCAEYHRPYAAFIENVEEFKDWLLFPQWVACWEALGYSLSLNVFNTEDIGIPQSRKRLYIVATQSKNPIQIKINKRNKAPVSSIINWDAGNWSQIDKPGRSEKTLQRVENGRKQHGERFVMPYYGSGSGLTGRSIDRPLGTVTTKDRWALVDGGRMRMMSVDEYRQAMGFREDLILPTRKDRAVQFLGNATCPPMVAEVLKSLAAAI